MAKKISTTDTNAADSQEAGEVVELSIQEKLAALEIENEAFRQLAVEQSERLAAHEKVNQRVMVVVRGRSGYVAAAMRTSQGILTPREIAADQKLCDHLVDIKSHIIRLV